jgi:hypothetical protein
MESTYTCPICHKSFVRRDSIPRHINNVHSQERDIKCEKKFPCPLCERSFTRKYDMEKHIRTQHPRQEETPLHNETIVSELISRINQLEENICELKNKPSTNQTLNVICVTGHDNYLDMLTDRLGDFNQAIEYIKDCALSNLAGDCKLIEKIYTNQNHEMSFTINLKQSNVTYHNEHQEKVTEPKGQFIRKLANNLQNSYLKGINSLIDDNLNQRRNPNQLLADYDLVEWNRHIYQLSDTQHQRKLLSQLNLVTTN